MDPVTFHFEEGELLLINKPSGWTSFDVVNKIRLTIKTKTGHAGTLDPLATGLLLICTGKATKRFGELQGLDKEYTGTLVLGATTPSYDMETGPDQTFPLDDITPEKIYATARSLTGPQEQMPPAYSAVKKDGEPAYKLARQGKPVTMKPRQVTIHAFDITRIELPEVDFRVHCSKGTYIRSLAHDFGQRLNNGAYLSRLCRTRIGPYRLEDAWNLEDFIKLVGSRQKPS